VPAHAAPIATGGAGAGVGNTPVEIDAKQGVLFGLGEPKCHSHSMVAGGLPVTSYTTRLMLGTSLTIRVAVLPSRS